MASEGIWPPQSPHHALLSSPSGRKKYTDYKSGLAPSAIKGSAGTPKFLDKLRHVHENEDHLPVEDDLDDKEDDEETLQLKLATIEARLKLKKLQSRSRTAETQPRTQIRSKTIKTSSAPNSRNDEVAIEVSMSPIKRPTMPSEQRSPSRVTLGIDKGVRAANVSLRRAQGTQMHLSDIDRQNAISQGGTQLTSATKLNRAIAGQRPTSTTFSERMAAVRSEDRSPARNREITSRTRARSFKINKSDIDRFKAEAEGKGPDRRIPSETTADLQCDVTAPGNTNESNSQVWSDVHNAEEPKGDASLFEGFSGTHLSSRVLPHTFLKRTLPLDQYTIYRLPNLLKEVTSPEFELPDNVTDFVVMGIIASKSSPLNHKHTSDKNTKSSSDWEKKWDDGSQNSKKFMVMTLTDLKWTIDLYLFDTALPRYHRLTEGTVIAILNPAIMPPKRGQEDTGAFSLTLHNGDDTVLEIGRAKYLGFCNAKKKDGNECGSWVNSSKTSICEWHLNAQIAKTQASRMGVNSGTNGFGGKGSQSQRNVFDPRSRGDGVSGRTGLLPTKEGRGFNRWTGEYYIASSNSKPASLVEAPPFRENLSAARRLDLDDPFRIEPRSKIEGKARARKQLAEQKREQQTAKKLADLGSGTSAGAEYMRRRTETDETTSYRSLAARAALNGSEGDSSRASSRLDPLTGMAGTSLKAQIGRKRAAEEVSLSPVKKKTRFVTSAGIKEAGRESVGQNVQSTATINDDDDDDSDGLDII